MNGGTNQRKTFASLDSEKAIPDPLPAAGEDYPLPDWYRAVRETPLEELEVEDICKACRQQIHLEHIVPISLQLLKSDPFGGGMYEGELLGSLKSVPADYWSSHSAEASLLKFICQEVRDQESVPDDLLKDVAELLTRTRD